jgi:hypothetical protein
MAEESRETPAGAEGESAGAEREASASTGSPAQSAADRWAPFDAVLEVFAAERQLAAGTYWGESAAEAEGRFVGWANACGWRCTLQLVRAPEEDAVVLVAQGPPLPGGRPRVMVLGGFPREFDQAMLRAALELGYLVGETWGPAAEPSPHEAGERQGAGNGATGSAAEGG